jgi:putative peptide zinc metalloprotease protein
LGSTEILVSLGSKRKQFTSIQAKGLRRLKLRSDLHVSEQVVSGKPSYVIKLPGESSYFRFGALEYEILSLCDGSRTPLELAAEMSQRHPRIALNETYVIDFLDTVESPIWERTRSERHLAFLARIREQRKLQIDHSSLLNIRFKPWNPDKFLSIVNRYCGWVFTSSFVLASVILFVTTVFLLGTHWDRIVEDTEALYSLEGRFSYDVVTFWALLLALEAIHEFGHGLVCKHFGGEVPEVGFSLVYFTPSIYMDTTDMLLLNRRQRYWVIFAGVWIELGVCGLATLVWAFSMPGTFLNDFAYKALLLTGIETIVWNLNPLIQADGYYALADYLGIDNLAERSQELLWATMKKHLLKQDLKLPVVSDRENRIFLAYGVASKLNMLVLAAGSLLFVKGILLNQFSEWGYVLLVGLLLLLAKNTLKRVLLAGKDWLLHGKNMYMAWKLSRVQKVSILGIALLLLIPPLPYRVKTGFILEPGARSTVRPKVDGKVKEVYVQEGERVATGQILARMENPEIEAQRRRISDEFSLVSSELRINEYQYDAVQAAEAGRERTRLRSELGVAEDRQRSLELIASADGVVATPQLDQKQGEFLEAGDVFCQIVNRTTLRARILVHDWDFQDIRSGAPVVLKVEAFPFTTYSGTVQQILPAAAKDQPIAAHEKLQHFGQDLTNYLTIIVSIENRDGQLREGMTGTAKISAKSHPLAWSALRNMWRWLRAQIF